MKDLISYFDLFGKKFNFKQKGSQKFQTYIGGLLSIICFIMTILFVFFFGSNFLYRLNPQITQQTILNKNYFKIPLNNLNLLIPFGIEDYNGVPVDFTGIIYPVVTYQHYEIDKNKQLQPINILKVNYTRCDSSLNYLTPNINISFFFCPDWGNGEFNFGGNWDGEFVHSFEISLNYCPNGDAYSKNGNCTSMDTLNELFGTTNNWYFTMYYPISFFSPESLSSPLNIQFANYYYQLSVGLSRYDIFNFKQVTLYDDQGWIMTSNETTLQYAYSETSTIYTLFPLDKYYAEGHSSIFYRCFFYLNKNVDQKKRTFMKFQELCAIVGGFMKILTLASNLLSGFFNEYKFEEFIFNEFFMYDKFTNNDVIINKNALQDVNSFISIEISRNERELKSSTFRPNNKVEKVENKLKKHTEFKNFPFDFTFMVKKKVKNFFDKNQTKSTDIYEIFRKFLDKKMDIINYFKGLNEIEEIKKKVFTIKEYHDLKKVRKFNLNDNEDIKYLLSYLNFLESSSDIDSIEKIKPLSEKLGIDKKIEIDLLRLKDRREKGELKI